MQYKSSFFMLMGSYFFATFVDIFGIWVLFDRFRLIEGWTFPELALIYGIIHMGFAVAECFARGFDHLSLLIKQGDFDRVLLRPLPTLYQVSTNEIQFMRLGRFLQGSAVLFWGISQFHFSLFSHHAWIIIFSILGAAALFYGLFIIQGAFSFWTIEALEIMNIATYGGMQMGQYPITIYNRVFRLIFTFVIPLSCVAYYPMATILQETEIPYLLGLFAPIFGFVFLLFSFFLWRCGVRRYTSSGN